MPVGKGTSIAGLLLAAEPHFFIKKRHGGNQQPRGRSDHTRGSKMGMRGRAMAPAGFARH